MAITSANQLELLQTAEAVAREKMIDPDLVIQAMEESLARAAKSRYGAELDIRVKIDRKTGRASFARTICQICISSRHQLRTFHNAINLSPKEPTDRCKAMSIVAVKHRIIVVAHDWNGSR